MLPKPIILVNNSSSSANTKSYHQNRYANADKVYVFGEIAIVSDKAVQNLSDNSITDSADDTAGFSKLYTEDGIGEYLGFKKLMGYTDSNKFAVYFKGTSSSYQVSVTDLRGLNDNELVTWNYNGRTITNTRKQCNEFFSDLSYLKRQFDLKDGITTTEWLHSTFGQIYFDWAEALGFSAEAERMVGNSFFIKIRENEDLLENYYEIVGCKIADILGLVYVYGFENIPYYVNEMTDEFMAAENATGVFNGIHMKKVNG